MKLYYSPSACSLSPHIILREGNFDFTLEKVDLKTKKTSLGEDFTQINPNGYVPALELDTGEILTEGPAILQYLADKVPTLALAPPNGTLPRYQVQSWLNFISTEIHKGLSSLFRPELPEAYRAMVLEVINKRFTFLNQRLSQMPYLFGDSFTILDAYLFTVLRWHGILKVDISGYSSLVRYLSTLNERPSIKEAIQAEKRG